MNTMTSRNWLMLAVASAFAVATYTAQATDILAKVNGKPIPQSRLDHLLKANTRIRLKPRAVPATC